VRVEGTKATLVLPHATITSVELLPALSRIYDSDRSWLFSQYEGLEVEALERARQQLRQETLRNQEWLHLTEQVARLQLIDFLRGLGFTEVHISFESSPR
jgi:hypothetical protein